MTVTTVLLLAGAGFSAGAVNAVAGGGSLISFPALVWAGLPVLSANVSNTVALWPGYLGSAAAYRAELHGQRERVLALGATSLVGGVVGSVVLLVAPAAVFEAIVPGLIVLGCALLAAQRRIAVLVARRSRSGSHHSGLGVHLSTFLAGLYGAYFGGGLGVILLAVLGIFLPDDLQRLNGLKTILSLAINTIALVTFVLFAPVSWLSVLVVAPASLFGGYVGAGAARKLSPTALRVTVIVFGLVVAVWLAAR